MPSDTAEASTSARHVRLTGVTNGTGHCLLEIVGILLIQNWASWTAAEDTEDRREGGRPERSNLEISAENDRKRAARRGHRARNCSVPTRRCSDLIVEERESTIWARREARDAALGGVHVSVRKVRFKVTPRKSMTDAATAKSFTGDIARTAL